MSNSHTTGFGQFVPGFEFLQSLSQGATAAMPAINNWVAPTLDPKELDKRIDELKAVQFWLDQNATALKATIQALEVQKMTLATLKGMNFNPADMAQAFKAAAPAAAQRAEPAAKPARQAAASSRAKAGADSAAKAAAAPDPMQFWGALTQQFQQIAAGAMNEVAKQAAAAPAAAKAAASKTTPARKTGARRR